MMKAFLSAFLVIVSSLLYAQDKGMTYSLKKLTQEAVTRSKEPQIAGPKMAGDTTFTIYSNCSVNMMYYFVDGEIYDPLFNPHPTGLYLNGQHFKFFCDTDLAYKQSVSMFVDVYEFKYLGRNYLCTFNLREEANGTSRYKCYNLFDLTDPQRIVQTSFSSIHQGEDTFGDFNMDGAIDFVRVIPKAPESAKDKKVTGDTYMINAYTFKDGKPVVLKNDRSMVHYIFAKGDDNVESFKVLQHDWMIPLQDTSGVAAAAVDYYEKYEPFDPKSNHLFTVDGNRVDKQRWTLHVGQFTDIGGAKSLCDEMSRRQLDDLYIMTDQYNGEIVFQVFFGNFMTKEVAEKEKFNLKRYGIDAKLRDFKTAY